MQPRILSVTAQPLQRSWESDLDWTTESAGPEAALARLGTGDYQAVILDCPLPGWAASDLLDRIQRIDPALPVFVHDPGSTASAAVRLAQLGVRQYLEPGGDGRRYLAEAIAERAWRHAACPDAAPVEEWERLLVGSSPQMREIAHLVRLAGPRRATVLITGETGTGKELAARALHLAGPRRRAAMVAVNCSALPENLLEAELFGHVRGAFTGAVQSRVGRFEQAQGGTLFLDEIGDLPLELQAKLLRVLQEREFQRVGSAETVHLDVRVIAATNRNLAEEISAGRFREDLYYRLNVVPLEMPPLRLRPVDVPALAAHFAAKVCAAEQIPLRTISPQALDRLRAHPWPGNVRQLENAVEMAVVMSGERTLLTPADFPLERAISPRPAAAIPAPNPSVEPSGPPYGAAMPEIPLPEAGFDYEETLSAIERSILEQALRRTGGNKKAAAQMLGLKRTTLSAKIRSLSGDLAAS
jgi:DNA-binding NtrC family response regulator